MPGVHLSPEGRAQAERLARRLRREAPVALYTSPQPRTHQTASLIAEHCAVLPEPCPALDEIDFGAWTGRDFAELEADPAWHRWNRERGTARPPGGEAMHEVQSRVLRWIESLPSRHSDATIVAVSHGDVIKAALAAHLGLSLDAYWRFDVAPASLSALQLWEGGGCVRFLNETVPFELES